MAVTNAELSDALFHLGETHPPGDERLAFIRAGYAIFDHPAELSGRHRLPPTVPLEALPTVTMLRTARTADALAAVVERLSGPHPARGAAARRGFLSAARVLDVLAGAPLRPTELRGAAHWHTQSSDGAVSLDRMASACLRRGYSWALVADHTRGLACVNGLDREGVDLQRRAVESWNRRHADELTVLHGLEAEILEDGSLDLPREHRSGVLVIAAVHTELAGTHDQTGRLLRALEEPGVFALAHPRGRLFARRNGIRANWEPIFRAAAAAGVLIEINGFPRRQDPDPGLLALARQAGCRFLLASDAHHPRHLGFDATGLALAVEAGIERDAIVNFAPLDQVREGL